MFLYCFLTDSVRLSYVGFDVCTVTSQQRVRKGVSIACVGHLIYAARGYTVYYGGVCMHLSSDSTVYVYTTKNQKIANFNFETNVNPSTRSVNYIFVNLTCNVTPVVVEHCSPRRCTCRLYIFYCKTHL
jgi:hypothetical protein